MTQRSIPPGDQTVDHLPLSTNGDGCGSVRCARCARENVAGAGRCAHCQAFLDGNQEAVTTGLFRRQQPIELRVEAETFVAGIVADKGGPEDLATLKRKYIANLGDVSVVLRLLVADIEAAGLFTRRGNPRAVLATYLATLDRFDRLAQRIGLERQPRPVTSALDFIEGRTK